MLINFFFFSSRRRHTRLQGDWSSDVCSSDLEFRFLENSNLLSSPNAAWCVQCVRHQMAFLKLLLLQAQLALVKKAFDFRRWSNDAVGGDSCRTGTERVIPASLSIGQRGKMVEVPA